MKSGNDRIEQAGRFGLKHAKPRRISGAFVESSTSKKKPATTVRTYQTRSATLRNNALQFAMGARTHEAAHSYNFSTLPNASSTLYRLCAVRYRSQTASRIRGRIERGQTGGVAMIASNWLPRGTRILRIWMNERPEHGHTLRLAARGIQRNVIWIALRKRRQT